MNAAVSKSIVDLLIAGGVESREEAAQLSQNLNGGSWTTQVLDSGKVDEQRFLSAIGNFFRVPVVTLDARTIDRQTLSILPSRFVFQHHILPIAEKDNSVVLATYDLFNSAGRQLVTQLLKKPAEWVLVPRAQLLRAMKTLYGVGAETFDEILKTNRGFEVLHKGDTATDINADDPEASVVKFVNQVIREAIAERATDIHVEPLENDIRIRYRIDGILHEVAVPPQLRVLHAAIISRLKVMLQMDVKPEIDFTFARGLRHILRQDPNVVMVGEIRDVETADIAIRAAMTGHLVFSTLHTNDAVGGITRLLDMDVEPFLLSSVVKAFIAQRLVRTICPDCIQMVDYPRDYLAEIGVPVKELGTSFQRGAGCDQCRHTGYQGRAAIYEICLITEPMRKLIMQKRDGGELKQCAVAEGMDTLRYDGWRRVAQGRTTIEEVVRATQTDEVMAETTEEAEPVMAGEAAEIH